MRVIVLYRRNSAIILGVDSERTRSARRSVNAIVNGAVTQSLGAHDHVVSQSCRLFGHRADPRARIGDDAQRVEITADAAVAKAPVTGRVFVFFSSTADREPRLQGGSYGGSVPFFGLDVEQWRTSTPAIVDAKVLGFPYESLAQMPAGDYYAQAMLVPYTKFSRADGHVIWVHNDQWEGQHFNTSPGNLVSDVQRVHWDPKSRTPVALKLVRDAPAGDRPARIALGEADQDQERAAIEVLGTADVHRRNGAAAQGLRRRDDASLSRRSTSRAISGCGAPFGFTEQSGIRDAPSSGRRALLTSAREPGLAVRARLDERQLPPHGRHHVATPHAVLRRFVRRELGEQRAVSGRTAHRARAAARKAVPSHPRIECAFSHRRIDRRMGMRRAADSAPRFLRRRLVSLPRSRRLPPQPAGRQLRRHERIRPERRARRRSPSASCRARRRASRSSRSVR